MIGSKVADPLHLWVDQMITVPWLESLLPADGSHRVCASNCASELRIKKALGKHGSQGGKDTAFDRERLEASVASHPCEITRAFGSASNLFRKLRIRAKAFSNNTTPKGGRQSHYRRLWVEKCQAPSTTPSMSGSYGISENGSIEVLSANYSIFQADADFSKGCQ